MKNLLLLCFILLASIASAQDVFKRNLYSADHVMELREELDLSEIQTTKIKKIHSENAGKFSTMKWDLDDATSKLESLLDQPKIDAVAVQKQMDEVLKLENSLKKQQLSTMVAIKNELTPAQQEILQRNRSITVKGYKSTTGLAGSVAGMSASAGEGSSKSRTNIGDKASSVSPQVSLKIAGTDKNQTPTYYLKTKDGLKEVEDIENIDPNTIASISVLKDKSASDLVGEKGKYGVIIITLKDEQKR